MAGKGCTVYFAGRNPAVLEAAIARMRASQPGLADAKLHALVLDLSSIASVVTAARSFSEPRLDIVVANAAVALDNSTALSEDGWERHFQVNHLGHFALVTTLLPLLQATAEAHGDVRIVCVSSIAHRLVREIDFDALTREVHSDLLGPVGSLKRYGQSKLSNILFAQELDRRLRDHGVTNVWVNSCHPGSSPTLSPPHSPTFLSSLSCLTLPPLPHQDGMVACGLLQETPIGDGKVG